MGSALFLDDRCKLQYNVLFSKSLPRGMMACTFSISHCTTPPCHVPCRDVCSLCKSQLKRCSMPRTFNFSADRNPTSFCSRGRWAQTLCPGRWILHSSAKQRRHTNRSLPARWTPVRRLPPWPCNSTPLLSIWVISDEQNTRGDRHGHGHWDAPLPAYLLCSVLSVPWTCGIMA